MTFTIKLLREGITIISLQRSNIILLQWMYRHRKNNEHISRINAQ